MTVQRSTQPWSYNVAATAKVRANALSDEDRRELLEMCGLVAPGSRVCVPDDVAEYVLVDPGNHARNAPRNVQDGPPRNLTTPPGLATLQPREAPTKAPRARKAASRKAKPKRQLKPIEHGTERGAMAHRRRKIPLCDPCRIAANTARRGGPLKPAKVVECGSPGGFTRHQRQGTPICDPCRLTKNASNRACYARKKGTAARALEEVGNAASWAVEAPRKAS